MTQLAEILERDFAAQVYDLVKATGFDRYHTYRSKRSRKGFPDETIWRERVVFLELKREKTRTTDDQKAVLRGLRDAGAEVYIVRPRNLDDLAAVLQARTGDLARWSDRARSARLALRSELNQELAT